MESREYQNFVFNDQIENKHPKEFYLIGCIEELGEVAGIMKRIERGDKGYSVDVPTQEKIKKELGDVFWYLTSFCQKWSLTLEEVFQSNHDKLVERDKKGNRLGTGSER